MKETGIRASAPKRFKATTMSKHKLSRAPNLVERRWAEFGSAPNRLWVSDITYVRNGFYRSNGFDALLAACNAGLGILRSTPIALEKGLSSGNLIRILEDYENSTTSIYAFTASSAFVPQKTKVLIEFIQWEFQTNKRFLDS